MLVSVNYTKKNRKKCIIIITASGLGALRGKGHRYLLFALNLFWPLAAHTSLSHHIIISRKMDEFKALHSQQLESMGFPDELYDSLFTQLEETFGGDRTMNDSSIKNVQKARETIDSSLDDSKGGKKIEVIMNPHIVSFDIHKNPSDGLLNALMARFDKNNTDGSEENDRLLLDLYYALCEADDLEHKTSIEFTNNDEDSGVFGENSVVYYTRKQVIELICNNAYLRLVLYRDVNQKIMAALPYPPYPKFIYSTENEEGTIIGPFPFAYMRNISVSSSEITCTFCSLSFLSPTSSVDRKTKYNLELVPDWSCPDPNLKMLYMGYLLPSLVNDIGEISYGLGKKAIEYCKESYAQFVHTLHLKRQKKLENDYIIYEGQLSKEENMTENIDTTVMKESSTQNSVVLLVYTEENDFMSLTHKEAGLTDKRFRITHDKQKISSGEVDIVFSHGSIFSPSSGLLPSTSCVDKNKMINQFPYEGAFVQKDHMAREIQNQHGLPRPTWAIESYDLDVQQREFIGAALFKLEDNNTESKTETMKPLWILKPNKGTQSQGHIVTRNLAQIRKVLDSGSGVSYVAQKYIVSWFCKIYFQQVLHYTNQPFTNLWNSHYLYRIFFAFRKTQYVMINVRLIADA